MSPGWGDIIMSPWVTMKQLTYDNAQRHVTAFRPISEAAHKLVIGQWLLTLTYILHSLYSRFQCSHCYNAFPIRGITLKLSLPLGRSRPPPNTWSLGPTLVFIPNAMLIGLAVFLQLSGEYPYTLQWGGTCPPKLPLPLTDRGPNVKHDSLGPPESTIQTVSRSVQPFCRAHHCDQQTDTDRQTTLYR